jgi:protein-tyrosine phosphatase
MDTPTTDEMDNILETIDRALEASETVYVHCYGGIGRTGTVVGCYLARHGTPGDKALELIAHWREGTPDGWRTSPETRDQRAMVLNWPVGMI